MIRIFQPCPIIKKDVVIRLSRFKNGAFVYKVYADTLAFAKLNMMLKRVGVVVGGKQYHRETKFGTISKK